MKYRDMLGFSKKQPKKKVVKEQPKLKVTQLLKEQFGDRINETLPALGKEHSNYSKNKKLLFKSIEGLAKGAGKADKTSGLEIKWMGSQLEKTFQKFEKQLDKVLNK